MLQTPERVRDVIRALFAHRCSGRILSSVGGRPMVFKIHAARIEPEHPFPLHWEIDEQSPALPFVIEIEGYVSVFRFDVHRAVQSDGFLAVPIPDLITRVRNRAHRRIAITSNVTVSFIHPDHPELRIRRPVRNVSFGGLGFSTSFSLDALTPDLALRLVTVEWEDRLRLEFEGVIRGIYDDADGHGDIGGIQLTPRSSDDRVHWRDLLFALLCPETHMDGTWAHQLWDLYYKSGYFQLSGKSELDFRPLLDSFAEASRKLAAMPELGCQVVWPSNRGVEAAASLLRIYEGTSFLYHLARQHGRTPLWSAGRAIIREIHMHAITHAECDSTLRWLLVWVQANARFSRVAYHDLPLRYVNDRRGLVWSIHPMEGTCEDVSERPDPLVRVGPATSREVSLLLESMAGTHPAAYCEAHDFVPERFWLDATKEKWRRAGLTRIRHVLTASDDDECAIAVLELADDGLHLFGLLDAVRVFALTANGDRLFATLLNAARSWYREQGKQKFVYVMEENAPLEPPPGFVDLGAAHMTLLKAELLPELLEHLHEIVAPRDVPPLVQRS